jgi:hypothetical protein
MKTRSQTMAEQLTGRCHKTTQTGAWLPDIRRQIQKECALRLCPRLIQIMVLRKRFVFYQMKCKRTLRKLFRVVPQLRPMYQSDSFSKSKWTRAESNAINKHIRSVQGIGNLWNSDRVEV